MSAMRVTFFRSGRPLTDTPVDFGDGVARTTDGSGAVTVELPPGTIACHVGADADVVEVSFVNASGRREARVDVPFDESPLDDDAVRAAMPSDRYVPLELVGRGAAGSVFRCRDVTLDRIVAVKLLSEAFAGVGSDLDAFLSEGRSLARLEHEHLINIYDIGTHAGRAYMVMRYVDGPDLETLVRTQGPLPSGAVAAAGVQLLSALDAVHAAGLIHRDVKPSNGLVSREGRVWLADFGLVRPLTDFTDPRSRIFGTPAYMAPEQLQGMPLGPAADIYGLGATLFHLAAGDVPFLGPNPVLSHLTDPAPDLRSRRSDAPAELAALLRNMMAKEPDERPHAGACLAVLQTLATSVVVAADVPYVPRLPSSGRAAVTSRTTGAFPEGTAAPAARVAFEDRTTLRGKRRPGLGPTLALAGAASAIAIVALLANRPQPAVDASGADATAPVESPAAPSDNDPAAAVAVEPTPAQEPSPVAEPIGGQGAADHVTSATVRVAEDVAAEAPGAQPTGDPGDQLPRAPGDAAADPAQRGASEPRAGRISEAVPERASPDPAPSPVRQPPASTSPSRGNSSATTADQAGVAAPSTLPDAQVPADEPAAATSRNEDPVGEAADAGSGPDVAVGAPASDAPAAAQEPAAEDPGAEEPAAEQPAADDPAADDPTVEPDTGVRPRRPPVSF